MAPNDRAAGTKLQEPQGKRSEGFEGMEGQEGAGIPSAGPNDGDAGATDAGVANAGDTGTDTGLDAASAGAEDSGIIGEDNPGFPDAGIDAGVPDTGVTGAEIDSGTPDAGTVAPPGALLWSKRFGGSGSDIAYSAAVDAHGNVVTTGSFNDTVDFGGGPLTSAGLTDVFMAKYDGNGNHLWSRRFGAANGAAGATVAVDAQGNAVVTGYFHGTMNLGGEPLTSAGYADIFIAKYDAAGGHVWSKRLGGMGADVGLSVAITDAQGNLVVTGFFQDSVDFGGGPLTTSGIDDVFVAKYDASGNHIWSKRFGGASEDRGSHIAVGTLGDLAVTGIFLGTADFGGGPLTSAGDWDIFLARYDANGNHLWSKRFGGTGGDYGEFAAVDAQGNTVVTGAFSGTTDFGGGPVTSAGYADIFIAKYDAAGGHVWSKRLGGMGADVGLSVAITDAQGNLVVTGFFQDSVDFGGAPLTSAGGGDSYVAAYDASGNHIWSQRFGGVRDDTSTVIAHDAQGNIMVSGAFEDTVDFGGGPLTSAGDRDIFLLKLAP